MYLSAVAIETRLRVKGADNILRANRPPRADQTFTLSFGRERTPPNQGAREVDPQPHLGGG